ncbi:hypothetical protein ILYODFUR_022691 [Ilyodon furcidens]|uniref:Uncharacterized protein n=1 Tax=Ilyodon furcidens TaxID=33524 RepID=A0ABV0TLW7_9TELE
MPMPAIFNSRHGEPQTCPLGPERDTEEFGAAGIQRPPRAWESRGDHAASILQKPQGAAATGDPKEILNQRITKGIRATVATDKLYVNGQLFRDREITQWLY